MRNYRRTFGEHFSEGARRLWMVAEREGLTHRALRARIARGFDVTRWLYGDVVPPVAALVRIQDLWAIPVATWLQPPSEPFTLPAMRDQATGTEGP